MTRVGAKRVRENQIILHVAVRAKGPAAAAQAVAVAMGCGSPPPPPGSKGRGKTDAGHDNDNKDSNKASAATALAYGSAVAAALGYCLYQLGGVRLSGGAALQLLSVAWEDARSGSGGSSSSSTISGSSSTPDSIASVSRTLRMVVTVKGLHGSAAARLVRAAAVCVRTVLVPLSGGGGGGRRAVSVAHTVALRVVRA